MTLPIFFANDRLLVVDKPHGWLTTPARLADDPRPCLGRVLQKQMNQQIFPVHRLDFEVSGLTLWARDLESHRLSQTWFEEGRLRKVYEALSRPGKGEPFTAPVAWEAKLVRGKRRTFAAPHGKPSRTLARVLSVAEELWRWELIAVTGRPHQLRFAMSQFGCPLLGDTLYGGEALPVENWLALRAVELDLRKLAPAERLGLPETLVTTGLSLP